MSCHKRSELKMESHVLIFPSPFPPLAGLSYSARARKPFLASPAGGSGWRVKLPNITVALSITRLPFRSSVSQASSLPAAVQDRCSAVPSLLRSKATPPETLVKLKPLPNTSITIGVSVRQLQPEQ